MNATSCRKDKTQIFRSCLSEISSLHDLRRGISKRKTIQIQEYIGTKSEQTEGTILITLLPPPERRSTQSQRTSKHGQPWHDIAIHIDKSCSETEITIPNLTPKKANQTPQGVNSFTHVYSKNLKALIYGESISSSTPEGAGRQEHDQARSATASWFKQRP